jgi:hypothetical protein
MLKVIDKPVTATEIDALTAKAGPDKSAAQKLEKTTHEMIIDAILAIEPVNACDLFSGKLGPYED